MNLQQENQLLQEQILELQQQLQLKEEDISDLKDTIHNLRKKKQRYKHKYFKKYLEYYPYSRITRITN